MVFPTLGYHAEWGLTLKIHNFTIAYRENYCTACGERIRGGERFCRLFDGSCTEAT